MTNGNDILEFEQANTERLFEEFCKMKKIILPTDENDYNELVRKITDANFKSIIANAINLEYWEFVIQKHSENNIINDEYYVDNIINGEYDMEE